VYLLFVFMKGQHRRNVENGKSIFNSLKLHRTN